MFGTGTVCIRQLVPFQDIASGRVFPVELFQPTAVQARAPEHDTPVNSVSLASDGPACRRHVSPFHRSTIACCGSPRVWPTAMHEFADVHETP
jgi:hypothetical protein